MKIFAEKSQNKSDSTYYSFILFVIEGGENSQQALKNLERLCEKWLPNQHTIEVVDVVEDFQTALDHNILVTPSLVIADPKPGATIHGDLSDTDKFLEVLNINKDEENAK